MLQPLFEHRLELAGYETRALELEGQGPPVLLLHGYADSADTWRSLLDLLARQDRRALAVDLPGFGDAGPLDPTEPILPQLTRFTAAAVEHLAGEDGEDVVVLGNSLGGCLSIRAAQDPGLPLRGVVPVAPAGFEHPKWFSIIERDPLLRALLTAPFPVPERIVRGVVAQVYRQLVFAAPRAAAAEVVWSFTHFFRTRDLVARHLATGRRLIPELRDCFALDDVRVPVLLIWGDRDRMVPHRGSRILIDAVPATEYEILPGIGHCPQLEAPHAVFELLERFCGAPAAAPAAA
ncbi:MAG: alpha/beta hydrolase [Solirubrobacterales bacterium]|nr:alpha/beta hydrolase [Solirubrobacterales bacterium]